LMSSPVLGRAAVWTPVTAGTVVVAGGNYRWTLPATGSAQYFRLQK
jgi:cell division protein FtsW (lipid II flippase)